MATEMQYLTEANKQHLAEGKHLLLNDYIEFDADGIAVLDGIKCKSLDSYPYQSVMRYDKYLEFKEHKKLCRFIDK